MLNYVDVAICLILFISVGIGIYIGFVKEALFPASLILAFAPMKDFKIPCEADVDNVTKIVTPLIDHWYLAEPDSIYALPVAELKSVINRHANASNGIQCFTSVSEAYNYAI